MDRQMHYRMAFRQGGVPHDEADQYINNLDETTLNKITALSFDRRLIKPIMEVASEEVEKNPDTGFNDIVSSILCNKIRMFTFMRQFCLR